MDENVKTRSKSRSWVIGLPGRGLFSGATFSETRKTLNTHLLHVGPYAFERGGYWFFNTLQLPWHMQRGDVLVGVTPHPDRGIPNILLSQKHIFENASKILLVLLQHDHEFFI